MASIRQIKAARALLGWSQEELATRSGVSYPTIARLESSDGDVGGRADTAAKIVGALESAGVEFTNGGQPGVKMRQIDMKSIERTRWPQWVEADTAEVAIAAIRKIWPQTTVVDDGRQHIVYLGLNQEIRAAEVDYLGNNRWRFRVKKPRYIAASPSA